MKYNDGRLYSRNKGQARTDKYERYLSTENGSANWDLREKNVIFNGQDGNPLNLDLTIGKEYKIIDVKDNDPAHNSKAYKASYVNDYEYPGCFQHPGRVIVIINDKGKKKKYYENLFALSPNQPEKEKFIEKFASDIFKVGDIIWPKQDWHWGTTYSRNFNRHSRHTITAINKSVVTLDNGKAELYINPYRNEFMKLGGKNAN